MSIPTHDKLILPFLQILADRKEHEITEIRKILSKDIYNYSKIDEKYKNNCYYQEPLDWLFSIRKTADKRHKQVRIFGLKLKVKFKKSEVM